MKRRIPGRIAAALIALGMSSSASASVTCLAPNPVCAIVIVGGIVTGIVEAQQDPDSTPAETARDDRDPDAIDDASSPPAQPEASR